MLLPAQIQQPGLSKGFPHSALEWVGWWGWVGVEVCQWGVQMAIPSTPTGARARGPHVPEVLVYKK